MSFTAFCSKACLLLPPSCHWGGLCLCRTQGPWELLPTPAHLQQGCLPRLVPSLHTPPAPTWVFRSITQAWGCHPHPTGDGLCRDGSVANPEPPAQKWDAPRHVPSFQGWEEEACGGDAWQVSVTKGTQMPMQWVWLGGGTGRQESISRDYLTISRGICH